MLLGRFTGTLLLLDKNWQKFECKTAPKVQKLDRRQASIPEFTVYAMKEVYKFNYIFFRNMGFYNDEQYVIPEAHKVANFDMER